MLWKNPDHHHLYIVKPAIKVALRAFLRDQHAVSQATLFADNYTPWAVAA